MIQNFVANYPVVSLIFISVIVTFVSTLIHKFMTDQEKLKNLKKRHKELQVEMKNCKEKDKIKALLQKHEISYEIWIKQKGEFKKIEGDLIIKGCKI